MVTSIINFFINVKTYLLLGLFLIIYLYDTGRSTTQILPIWEFFYVITLVSIAEFVLVMSDKGLEIMRYFKEKKKNG